ncbi:MAG: DUF4116 domain-containing protein [Legionella sp.]|jgi:serine/threonine protein kinase
MALFSIRSYEWDYANELLSKAPNGTKLKSTSLPLSFASKHSFVKINGKLYGLTKRNTIDPRISDGTMAHTKYAQDEQGNLFIVKIIDTRTSSHEQSILQDLSVCVGSEYRNDKPKQYIILKHLGRNLKETLNDIQSVLSAEQRLDIAIKLTYQVYQLHQGLLSTSKVAYAHKDIKLDNITIDNQNNVHLIDFGLSHKDPFEKSYVSTGATFYTAYPGAPNLTGADIDIIALKRSLFLPQQFYCRRNHLFISDYDYANHNPILPINLIDQYNLHEFINTFSAYGDVPKYTNQIMDPIIICAALINARQQLGISNDALSKNTLLCHALVGSYFGTYTISIQEITKNITYQTIAGILHRNHNMKEFDKIVADTLLINIINQANNTDQITAILKLQQLNLTKHFDLIIDTPQICELIAYLDKLKRPDLIEYVLENYSPGLLNIVQLSKLLDCTSRVASLCTNKNLLEALNLFAKDETSETLKLLIKNPEISDANIIDYCTNNELRAALDILRPEHTYMLTNKSLLINLFEHKDVATAVLNLFKTHLNKQSIFLLIQSKISCMAFNILYNIRFIPHNIVEKLLLNESLAKKILWINASGFSSCIHYLFDPQISTDGLTEVLNSKYKNQITLEMVNNQPFLKTLSKNGTKEDRILALITLSTKKLASQQILTALESDTVLFDQISSLIKNGHADLLNADLMKHPMISTKALMLQLVTKKPIVLASAHKTLINDAKFMLSAIKINIDNLKYADHDLLSSSNFIQSAMQINYKAYKYATNKYFIEKSGLKKSVLHYQYSVKEGSRFHLFAAKLKNDEKLENTYKHKTGDALKTAILKAFKISLEGKNSSEIDEQVKAFKMSKEYKVICSSQGITSRLFKLPTTSARSVEQIIEDARMVVPLLGQ